MRANNIKDFFHYLVKNEQGKDTLKLVEIIYSKKFNQEVCRVQLIGKNIFPLYRPEEIINDLSLLNAFSKEDIVKIKDLEFEVNQQKFKKTILEIDINGTVVLGDSSGQTQRYAEKYVSNTPQLLDSLNSIEAHALGYRVGYKDCENDYKKKNKISKFKGLIKKFVST